MRMCWLGWLAVLGAVRCQDDHGHGVGDSHGKVLNGTGIIEAELDLWINFGPAGVPLEAGWLADSGAVLNPMNEVEGQVFGWMQPTTSLMTQNPDGEHAELSTFVQLGANAGRLPGGTMWKLALPDGLYEVTFAICDTVNINGGRLTIQDRVVLDALGVDPVDTSHNAVPGLPAGEMRTGTEYVHVLGGFLTIGRDDHLNPDSAPLNYVRVQHHRINDDPRTFFVGQINVPIAEQGTTPDGSARDEVPLITDCDAIDRAETSRVAITRNGRQFCQNELRGGGWTLVMKISDSSDEFWFGSQHWTNATVFNEDDRSLEPGDAKFPAFNTHQFTEWLAHWPDLEGAGLWQIGPFPAKTSLEMFQTPQALSENATSLPDWNSDYFSTQPGLQRYGIAQGVGASQARWGYSWTQLRAEDPDLDLSVQTYYSGRTSAAGGGIGLVTDPLALRSAQSSRQIGAGDWYGCPGHASSLCGHEAVPPNVARGSGQAKYRAHIYGRATTAPNPQPTWVPVNADEAVSFELHHYEDYAKTGELHVRSCLVYSDFSGGGVHIRLRHTTAPVCVDDPDVLLGGGAVTCSTVQQIGYCGNPEILSSVAAFNAFSNMPDITADTLCPVTCVACPPHGGDVLFEDMLAATSSTRRETEHYCGMWHDAHDIECGSTLGTSCKLEVVHESDAQLYLYDYTLEVAVIDSYHHLSDFHVGRLDVRVSHEGVVGNTWKSVSEESGFGLNLDDHYSRYVEAPFAAFNISVSSAEAEHDCHEYGGHLASVHSDEELEALAAAIAKAGLAEQQVLIGAAKNISTGLWEFIDGTYYDEAYMSSRNFLAFGHNDLMSMVVYPAWHELFGSPINSGTMSPMPFACSRTAWVGHLRLRACAAFSETTGDGGNVTLRLRRTDEARRLGEPSVIYMEDTFMASPSQNGVVHMQCGEWYDADEFYCGNTMGTACQVDMMHSSSVAAVKLYEYGIEVAVEHAPFHSTTHYSGRISIPVASKQLFNYSAVNGDWMHIGARDGMGFSLPAYGAYANQNVDAQLVRFCAVYTDNAEGGDISLQLRATDVAGGAVFVESMVGSATRSVGQLLRTGCGPWETLNSLDCDSTSGCQMYLKHSNDTADWRDSSRDRQIRVYSVDMEVASCYAGFSLVDGDCVPNVCTDGLHLNHSDTVCSGSTGDGCIYHCHEGFHWHNKHECRFTGLFEGGECKINLCANLTVPHSSTTCSGFFGDNCTVDCDQGYHLEGRVSCARSQAFEGGYCAADFCNNTNQLPDSSTHCTGFTGQTCDFQCNPGWTKRGVHTCMTTGWWTGGFCDINPCTGGLTIGHSPTQCAGNTGNTCPITCRSGYRRSGTHVCQPNGHFQGAQCLLDHPCLVERGTLGADDCHSDANCERTEAGQYDCLCKTPADTANQQGFLFGVRIGGFHGTGQDCDAWTECQDLISYETAAPTDENDRACSFLTSCNAGEYELNATTYFSDRICAPCPIGTYQPNAKVLGEANDQVCLPCPHGWTDHDSDPATACRRCGVGTYQPNEGAFGPEISFACPMNTADLDFDSQTPCTVCPEGFQSVLMQTTCEAIICRDLTLEFSSTNCQGATGDQCDYECNPGYTIQGNHTCTAAAGRIHGYFTGGLCTPDICVGGLDVPYAVDTRHCGNMVTQDVCTFSCTRGYLLAGSHTCMGSGVFEGGYCDPQPCAAFGSSRNPSTSTICTGKTNEYCEIECNAGYLSAAMVMTKHGYDNNITREQSMLTRYLPSYAYDGITRTYRCTEDGTFQEGTECKARGCFGVDHGLEVSSNMGNCPATGFLEHGQSCSFACEGDLDLIGEPTTCMFGNLSEPQQCRVTWDAEGMQRNRYIMYGLFGTAICLMGMAGWYALMGGRQVVKAEKQKKVDYEEFGFAADENALKGNPHAKDKLIEDWLFINVGLKPAIVQVFMGKMTEDNQFLVQNDDDLEFAPAKYVSQLYGKRPEDNRGSLINNLKLMDWGIDNTGARTKIIKGLTELKKQAHQKIAIDMMEDYETGEIERPILGEMPTPIPEWLASVVKLDPDTIMSLQMGFESIGAFTIGDLIEAVPIDGMTDLRLQEAGVSKPGDRKTFVKHVRQLKKSIDGQTVKMLMSQLADVEFDGMGVSTDNPLAGPRLTYATGPLDEMLSEVRDIFKNHNIDLREAFEAFDVDGDGVVSVDEFREGLTALNMPISMDQAEQLMAYFDKDNSGEIDMAEFVKKFGDEVKAERHAEAMALMSGANTADADQTAAQKKQFEQDQRKATRMAQRKFESLEEFIRPSTAKDKTKEKLLKFVRTRQELSQVTLDNIAAMGISDRDQQDLVRNLKEQAEMHFKKKAALNDEYHSSDEEHLSDEEELDDMAEAGRAAFEAQQRLKTIDEPSSSPEGIVTKFLNEQRPAQVRQLCMEMGLPTKGVSKKLKDSLHPVLLADQSFMQDLMGRAGQYNSDDSSESEDSDVEGAGAAEQFKVQGEMAMAQDDFVAAVAAYEKAYAIEKSTLLEQKLRQAKTSLQRTQNADRIKSAQEARDADKVVREENKAAAAAEREQLKECEKQRMALVHKGEAAIRAEQFEEAIALFEEGMLIDPDGAAEKPTPGSRQLAAGLKKVHGKMGGSVLKEAKKLVSDAEAQMRQRHFASAIAIYQQADRVEIDEASAAGKEHHHMMADKMEKAVTAKTVHEAAQAIYAQAQAASASGNVDAAIELFTSGSAKVQENVYAATDHVIRDGCRKGAAAEKQKKATAARMQARRELGPVESLRVAPGEDVAARSMLSGFEASSSDAVAAMHVEGLRPAELRKMLTARGLEAKGLKKDLVARLVPALATDAAFMETLLNADGTVQAEELGAPAAASPENVALVDAYIEPLRPAGLRSVLEQRGLDKKGLKKDLQQRLKDSLLNDPAWLADAANPEAEDV